ncbi:PEP-CTERM sorting domain-containing protein [Desulfobacter sp.]|uniref:PEP-CTERM sorting domain-containing protein n=1 Tax=Desulfobacter sp. TaxID=2294 RepID=UPI000E974DCB|nr:PEP-CTERM sorting domain-containing protein [Desulfobacter sp.]HBT87415.1 hypothetical protein [Desulfobacter sp.]
MKRKFLLFDSVLLIFGLFSLVLLPVNVTAYTIDGDDVLTAINEGFESKNTLGQFPTQEQLKTYLTGWTHGAFGIWLNYDPNDSTIGIYDFTVKDDANDPLKIIENYLRAQGLDKISVSEEVKVEEPEDENDVISTYEGYLKNGYLTVSGYDDPNPTNSLFGGWEWAPPEVAAEVSKGIDFWMVKAGNDFTLWTYGEEDGSFEGYWTTSGLVNNGGNQPELSHFTAYFGTGEDGNGGIQDITIPEPATLMLFGIGLLGLARVSRRKK